MAAVYAALAIPPFAVGSLRNLCLMRLTFWPLTRKLLA